MRGGNFIIIVTVEFQKNHGSTTNLSMRDRVDRGGRVRCRKVIGIPTDRDYGEEGPISFSMNMMMPDARF